MTTAVVESKGRTRDTYSPDQEVKHGYLSHLDTIGGVSAPDSKDTWDLRLWDRFCETRDDPRQQLRITQMGTVTIAQYAARYRADSGPHRMRNMEITLMQSPREVWARLTETVEVPGAGWADWYQRGTEAGVIIQTEIKGGSESIFQMDRRSAAATAEGSRGSESEQSQEWTSVRIAKSLLGGDAEINLAGLRELVLRAEDTAFTLEQSADLGPCLLDLARRHRESDDPQDEPMVWSAIRTGASMLRPGRASLLLPLLKPGHPIETSLVALKMLGRIFEAQPPDAVDAFVDLAEEVRGIANSLLDKYTVALSRPATMAQLAIYALAAMASSETLEVVRIVRGLEVTWFTKRTEHKLRELRVYWGNRPTGVADAPRELLDRALEGLHP